MFLDSLRFQFNNADYNKSAYSDLTSDNKVESRFEPGKMISEDELKKEWKDQPEMYEDDCHKTYDLTPQLLDKFDPDNQ
jgi:hypothetical protein